MKQDGSDILHEEKGLSPKFWQLAHALSGGWDMMNHLLAMEWETLRNRQFASIWNIGRQKERLASQLKAIEERIDAEIPCGKQMDSEARWKALLRAASPEEVSRLVEWKASLASGKKRAFITNRRLWLWISEQQEIGRQLTAILAGRHRPCENMTYNSSADLNGRMERTGGVAAVSPPHAVMDDGFVLNEFVRQRAHRAVKTYRRLKI